MNQPTDTAVQMKNGDGHLTNNTQDCRPTLDTKKRFLSVKEISEEYSMSLRVIYNLIKTDPTFPYINMGVKKKLMIDLESFDLWLIKRTLNEQKNQFKIPDLMELTKGRNNAII